MQGYSYPPGGPPADLLVEGRGRTLGEAVANVALGMLNAITPLEGITERETYRAEAEGTDLQSLILNILDEILFLNDSEGLTAKSLTVEIDEGRFRASAVGQGERFSAATHEVGIAVKAVTYHMMKIERTTDGYRVQVVFDT
ncbi:MAG: archease [Candidatus Bathyarchaeota archaeon]|nr:archease [Candidatus Bathyarchaeota archaeon]